jgi:cell division cycle protein 37
MLQQKSFLMIFKKTKQKHDLMNHVAHQSIVMQFILELSKSLKQDPRSCVGPFFSKMQIPTNKYKEGFSEELKAFKARIQHRAQEKLAAAMKEVEEEERKQRLGPGGLDPVEVLESLPEKLKQCFESKDVKQLEEALSSMKDEEAEYHMDRCVKAGLWKQENDSS